MSELFALNPKYAGMFVKMLLIAGVSVLLGVLTACLTRKKGLPEKLGFLEKECRNKKTAAIAACCATAAVWFFQSGLDMWSTTDDFYISCVLNSVYSKENYCYFLSPILAEIIRILGAALPNADVFALLCEVLSLGGHWCFFYIMFRSVKTESSIIIILFIIALNNKTNLLHLPFTAMTAALAFYGFFILYAVLIGKADRRIAIAGTVLLFFSMNLRQEAFLIMIPFVLLVIIAELFMQKTDRKKYLYNAARLFIPVILMFAVIVGIKTLTDNSEKYRHACDYNNYRSEIEDYTQKPYEKCGDKLAEIGVSENDFTAVKERILADRSIVTSEYLKNIAGISSGLSAGEKMEVLLSKEISDIINVISYSLILQSIILAVILLVRLIKRESDMAGNAVMLLSCAGELFIFAFLFYLGRMMSYVIQAIFFGIWLAFVSVFLREGKKEDTFLSIAFRKTMLVAAVALMICFYSGYSVSPENSVLTARESQAADVVGIDENKDTLYVWGVYDYGEMLRNSYFFKEKKLLSQEFISHNIVDGEWQYEQPYYLDYLKDINVENPMRALIEREHTYYIANKERCDIVLTFLQEHYDERISVEKIGDIDDIPIWKFTQ